MAALVTLTYHFLTFCCILLLFFYRCVYLQFPSFKKQAEELASYCITDASICELHRFTRDDKVTQMELMFHLQKQNRVNEIFYQRHLSFHWWQYTKFFLSLDWFENLERNRNMDLFSPPYFVPPLHYENLFSVSVYCIRTIPVPALWVSHHGLLSASVPLLDLPWLLYLFSAHLL